MMPRLYNLYLFAYNSFQTIGWTIAVFRIASSFISSRSLNGAYASSGDLICFLQTAAFLEIIHGAIGLVPSGALLPLMQWGGRTHFLLAIVRQINEVQELPSVFITFIAWSLSESKLPSCNAIMKMRFILIMGLGNTGEQDYILLFAAFNGIEGLCTYIDFNQLLEKLVLICTANEFYHSNIMLNSAF
ncbi:uncharacterized protein LOC125421195 isoform X3 [Ziziphus jujuba]|uniref:Very-long-chain (3R)-3-hydroxyacyl-CoA dehydratase n=1 Tax=Ziziphus jujuba TaxID=326968 RepID=A0ABM3IBZ3_ZIZJJ|nr:uncharacterized protein LOC125421195 isoform X3 [Ziziphus jujuba]